jgi:His-Xaa-Ser system protein HxsD
MSAGAETERPDPLPPEKILPEGVTQRFEDGALRVSLPIDVYGLEAILRSCYWLTEHCFVYLGRPAAATVEITLVSKSGRPLETDQFTWDFLNDLVDQRLRVEIQAETRSIREMIVAQAFAEVDLIDDRGKVVDPSGGNQPGDDPEGIRRWRPAS